MPTRRKTIAGGAGLLLLLGSAMLVGDENRSDHGTDGGAEEEPDPRSESEHEPELDPDQETEPGSDHDSDHDSDRESEPDDRDVRLETTVAVPDGDQRLNETVEFGVTVENVGDTSDEYTVTLDLDRVDPDTDFGGGTWDLSGELDPDEVERHVAEHYYQATGTYELRLDGEVVEAFEVLNDESSRSTSPNTGSQSSAGSDDAGYSDDDPAVGVGGQASVNGTEESASKYVPE